MSVENRLGIVVGVVVVRRGGHRWSSPEFVEHELLLGGTQRRAGDGVPCGVDVAACPALGDEDRQFAPCFMAGEVCQAAESELWVVRFLTTNALAVVVGGVIAGRHGGEDVLLLPFDSYGCLVAGGASSSARRTSSLWMAALCSGVAAGGSVFTSAQAS